MTQAMRFDIDATDRASSAFLKFAENVDRLEKKLRDLDRVKADPKVTLDTRAAEQQARQFMSRLRNLLKPDPKITVQVDTTAGMAKVDQLKAKMSSLSNVDVKVDVDVADSAAIAALRADLTSLSNASVKVDIDVADSSAITALRADLASLSNATVKVELDIVGAAGIAGLQSQLASLSDSTVRISVDSGTGPAQVNALIASLLDLEALSPVRVRVDIDGPGSAQSAELDRVKAVLDSIDGRTSRARVDVTGIPDAATVARLRAVAVALGDLDGRNANATVSLTGTIPDATELRRAARALKQLQDIGAIVIDIRITGDTDALVRIAALRAALGGIPSSTSTTVNVDVDKSLSGRLEAVGKSLAKFGSIGGLAAAGLGSATAAIATLAGSLTSLVGLAPIAVGALSAFAVVSQTVKLASIGMGDAMKALADGKLDKFAEAVSSMSAEGKKFALTIQGLKAPFDNLRRSLQDKMFDGFNKQIVTLASTYIPLLKSGMGGVATQINLLGKDFVSFATSAGTVRDVDTIFRNTTQALQNARPAAINLAAAFRDIAVVGTGMLPGLADGLTAATARFRDFIAEARQSGQLQQWIQGGIDTLQTLGSIAGNVGSILGSVFTAAKASGADFLSTIDSVTSELAELLKSSQGQNALVAFFTESRAAIDALMPGLRAVAGAALDLVAAFSKTGALENLARTLSDIGTAVAPLGATLGQLAGDTLNALANGAQVAIGALSPIVGVVTGVIGSLGPLPGLVLAAVVAFKALSAAAIAAGFATIGARIAALAPLISTYVAGLTGSIAAGSAASAATTRLGTAVSGLGKALPIIAVGMIAIGAAYEEFGPKADQAAQKVINGSLSMREAIAQEAAQIHKNQIEWLGGMNAQESYTAAAKNVRIELDEQMSKLGPMAQLQAKVSMAQADLNDAVAEYGPSSSQAAGAADRLSSATSSLKTAQDGAAKAAMSHTEAIKAQADEMNSQIGTALAYEDAVRKTAEAHKAAADALKSGGKDSAEYRTAVSDLTRDISAQADAARQQGEALGGTEAGIKAYNTELLKAADLSTQAGRDAFGKLASSLDKSGLAALDAAAKMSGLKTEVMTLPDGRTVTVVVAADQSKLDSVRSTVDEFTSKEYIGKITITGDATKLGDVFKQQVTLVNGTTATMTLDANGAPLDVKIGQSKYKIDATTGVMQIDGNPGPGEENLSGFKVKVDSTTGVMTIEGNEAPAKSKVEAVVTFADGKTGTITIDGNPTKVNGVTTAAVKLADGSTGTISIDGDQVPVNGKITATIRYADGSTGTIKLAPNDLVTPVIDRLKQPTSSTHTITVVTVGATVPAGTSGSVKVGGAGGGLVGFSGGGVAGPKPLRLARGGVIAGYAPGKDTVPAVLSKGEAVLVPELVRAIGPQNILAANYAASGRAPTMWSGGGVAQFAAGGLASWAARPMPSISANAGSGQAQLQQMAAATLKNTTILREMTTLLRERLGVNITVEDRTGDPVATARATQLALLMAH